MHARKRVVFSVNCSAKSDTRQAFYHLTRLQLLSCGGFSFAKLRGQTCFYTLTPLMKVSITAVLQAL